MERLRDHRTGPTQFRQLFQWAVLACVIVALMSPFAAAQDERRRLLIDLPLLVNGTDGGVVAVDMANPRALEVSLPALTEALSDVLDPELFAQIGTVLSAEGEYFPVDELEDLIGLQVGFDSRSAAIALTIPTEQLRPVEISVRRSAFEVSTPDEPARRSAFVNVRLSGGYVHESDFAQTGLAPTRVDLDGAARLFGLSGPALVGSLSWNEDLPGNRWQRGDVFLVQDDAERTVRARLGDLSYATAPFQGGTAILGLAIEREYDTLAPTRLVQPSGRFDFVLEQTSLVQVFLNGALLRTLRLRAGRYDVRDFAFFDGSNDIEIFIEDDAGRRQRLSFSAYSDKALLRPGLSEFTYAVGFPFERTRARTEYDFETLNASFRHRFGVTDRLTAAVDGQSDGNIHQIGGGVVFAGLGGAIEVHAAASGLTDRGDYDGAIEAAYEIRLEDFLGLEELRFDIAGDYAGANFLRLGEGLSVNEFAGSTSARLAAPLPGGIYASAGARYEFGRLTRGDSWGVNATLSRPFGPVTALMSLTADRAFDEDDTRLGAFVSVSARLGRGRFSRVRYDSLTRATIVEALQPARSRPGALGWTAAYDQRPGQGRFTGEANYVANRFEAEASHEVNFTDPSNTLSEQRTRANFGFSIATADGAWAVGRPIGENFAIISRHPNLGDRALDVDGESGESRAIAGGLGPALLPDLSSYRSRRIPYSVEDLPPGYDLGRGEFEVNPTVYSGYTLRVGSDAAATAVGAVTLPDGSPVVLAGGRVVRVDGEGEPISVFTNRRGRFVAAGLSAGRWRFEVRYDQTYAAEFIIPDTAAGLVQVGQLDLQPFAETTL